MRTDFSGALVTELGRTVTEPVLLVEMGFSPVIRYSSREQITYLTYTWLPADVECSLSDAPTLRIFNESLALGTTVLAQGTAGRYVKIYVYYAGNGVLAFSGQLGDATIGDYVAIQCRKRPPNKTPRFHAIPPHCNFVPRAGQKIAVGFNNVIVLESK
jgi:hypothetical protein